LSQQISNLFEQLKAQCADEWRAYCEHDFVEQLGAGSLPEPCFRHYLLQDYLFLIHFARAHALQVYKAENLTDMTAAATALNGLLATEMSLHVGYCRSWGIDPESLEQVAEAPANMAYTRYVLERGLAGDMLDLHVALLPCTVGYAEIGARLIKEHAGSLEQNPYRSWIEAYAADDYQAAARQAVSNLERFATRASSARFDALCKTFRQATRLEIGFWDMGLAPDS